MNRESAQSIRTSSANGTAAFPIETARVAYVLKRYPRFSETFIVNEILAHEAAGMNLEIFALRLPDDGRFHEALAQVRAPVTYLPKQGQHTVGFWGAIVEASQLLPGIWSALSLAKEESAKDVFQAVLLAQAVCARGINHLHAHFGTVATTVARLAALFSGRTYSFTAHAKDIFHQDVRLDDMRRKLEEATAVITVSDYNVQFLRQRYGPAAGRVQRVYNGLDLARFAFASPEARPARIVGVGRLVEKKGFGDLIWACKILKDDGRDFQCDIIGGGMLEEELRDLIADLGLLDRVRLLGPLPQHKIIEHVKNAAVLAAPCVLGTDGNRDGLPTVLLEAMALGTPCVSTDVTGIPELLEDEVTGLMAPQRNLMALATALARLLEDGQLRATLAAEARKRVESGFDIHRNAAEIRRIIAAPTTERTHAAKMTEVV